MIKWKKVNYEACHRQGPNANEHHKRKKVTSEYELF